MTLKRTETSEVEFIEILKSKHARYVDGGALVSKELVVGDYLPPGTVLGKCTTGDEEDKYGPVTRGEVESVTHGTDKIEVKDEADLWNFQVGDVLDILDADGESQNRSDNDLTITNIDVAAEEITVETLNDDEGSEDYSSVEYVQKTDGTSKAALVCTHGVDVREEDKLVGGIVHGAVYKDRLQNFDALVEADLSMVSFE